MGKFEQALVDRLLALSPKEKRDELEGRIVALIGGDPNTIVTHLPRRRGRADGGIDGRVRVVRLLAKPADAGMEGANELLASEVEAAINVRVRKSAFARDALGAFVNDMDRESLEVGIIVTASGLARDAAADMERLNQRGKIILVHLPLQDIVACDINIPSLRFANGDLCKTIRANLEQFIRDNEPQDERAGSV